MEKWISVNDAVPPDDRDVLAIQSDKVIENGINKEIISYYIAKRVIYKNGTVKWKCSHGTGFIDVDWSGSTYKVTHWMPLPERPNK